MTKAARIRALLKEKMPGRIIADVVGCRPEYVRAVKQREDHRRRNGTCWRDFDHRWYEKNRDKRLKQMRAAYRARKAEHMSK